jgi:tripartite ATP-independent transporter DctM subunit
MVVTILFFVLLAIGIPVFIVLGLTGIIYMFDSGNTDLFISIPQQLFSSLESFNMLAIPLFILAGELMNFGGITTRLVTFAKSIIGHFKGGLAYVNVVANTFLASILGSSLAQTAMMSRVMVPAMEKEGYDRTFSTSTTAAAAMMGPIIPPSMTFIIFSVSAETSIGTMFLAGIVPGVLLAISFILLIAYYGYKLDLPKSDKSSIAEIGKSFLSVIPALAVPLIIIGGIMTGAFTATESAAVACLVAFLAGIFFYKELNVKDIPKVLTHTGLTTATVTTIIAMATIFGYSITFERVPQLITEWMVTITENPLIFLLLINLLLLLVGMVLDGIASLIILTPILAPVASLYGIDLVHFGVIMCLNLVIGSLTPPVGAGLFIASSVAEVKYESLVRGMVPFLVVAIIVLFIVTYWPELILWNPNTFN